MRHRRRPAADRTDEPILDAFELYVDDDRYSVPTLYLMPEADEASALRMAHDHLQSEHHSGVELWRRGERVLALGSSAPEPDESGAGG